MKYAIVIERADKGQGAFAPDSPGVGVVGDSADEVGTLLREAFALHIEGLREDGQTVAHPTVEIDYIESPAA